MIKTPLSTVIGGAFWTPGATVIHGAKLSFETVMKKLFANGEQGFWYDPNDLSTMFQDATGTAPVTGVGQPVGLMLDKGKGLVRDVNIANPTTVIGSGIGGAEFKTTTVSTTHAVGKWYKVSMQVSNFSGTLDVGFTGVSFSDIPISSKALSSNGIISFKARATDASIKVYTRSVNNADFSNISIKEISGNHAYQTTSAARPLLQNAPRRIDFDTVDDKLITNLPARLTGCTVIRSVPGVGTQILTGQTIPATYEDNKDHCGLIVINRALTPSETSAITAEFNKRAGV